MATPILRSSSIPSSAVLLRSKLFIPSQRLSQAHNKQPVLSSELLEKGGFIRRTGAGLYAWMPPGQRVLERLTSLIDIHMTRVEGQKLQMPALTPATLWKATKRWDTIGDELIRVQDRVGQDYCLGPTHEEAFTDLVASMSLSTKALPLRLYQISPKYRDELRPRGALMRAREFLMKDMYSFDATYDDAMASYDKVFAQYLAFFADIQLPVVPVRASAGTMGGSYTHEFQVLNEAGEDTVATCSCGQVACNIEVANRSIPRPHRIAWDQLASQIEGFEDLKAYKKAQSISAWLNERTPRDSTEEGDKAALPTDFHHIILKRTVREKKKEHVSYEDLFVFKSTGRNVNEDRLGRLMGEDVQMISPASAKEQKLSITSARFCFDWSIHDAVQVDSAHLSPEADANTEVPAFPATKSWGDFTEIMPGDHCSEASCPQNNQGVFTFQKGIEVGQTFYLGQKYSQAMKATIQDYANKPVPLEMGCYGLGVSRILQAVVEQYHTERGVRWPLALAPFHCVVIPLNLEHQKDAVDFVLAVKEWCPSFAVEKMFVDNRYKMSMSDRKREAELLGATHVILVGKQWEKEGLISLIANTIESPQEYHPVEKTLDTLKTYFQTFEEQHNHLFFPENYRPTTPSQEGVVPPKE